MSNSQYEDLYKWVEEHQITRPKRNINRDFADAMPLVEILKFHYPKMVELHNYTPKNAYTQKIVNWNTLNRKVLKKLGICLSVIRIEKLAKGEPGAIESLLNEIKKLVESGKSVGDQESLKLLTDGLVSQVAPLTELQSVLTEKEEAIVILQKKVEHLENILEIKEERIKALSEQLQNLETQSKKTMFGIF